MLQTVNMSNDPFRVGSNASTGTTTSRRRGPSPSSTFPAKLFKILSDPENSHIITWMPHGRSWRMLQPTLFSEKVAPKYFSHQSKYSSFMRQVNGWGFKRITRGPDRNSYYHELFIRDEPQLARTMSRRSSGSDKSNKDSEDIEPPNFYEMTGTSAKPAGHVHGSNGSGHLGMKPHNPSGSHAHSGAPNGGHPSHGGGPSSGLAGDDPHQNPSMNAHSGGHVGGSFMHDRHISQIPSHNAPVHGTDLPPGMTHDSMAYYSQQSYQHAPVSGYSQHQVYPPPWQAYPFPSYPYPSHVPPDHMGASPLSNSASVPSNMRSSVNDYASTGAGSANNPPAPASANAPLSGGAVGFPPLHPSQYPAVSHHDGTNPSWYGYGQPYGPPNAQHQGHTQGYNYYPSYSPHPPSSYSGGGGYDGEGAASTGGASGPPASTPVEHIPHQHYGGDLSRQHHPHHGAPQANNSSHSVVHGSPSNPSTDQAALNKYFETSFSRIEGGGSDLVHSHVAPAIKEEGNGGDKSSPSNQLSHQQEQSSSQQLPLSVQRPSDPVNVTGKISFKAEHPYDQLF